jgi:protein-tyrosine phosphatase
VWINLREEAVVYVDGTPFTARRSAKLNENDLVPGITGHTVHVLEAAMKQSLQEQLALSQGTLEYWNEAALHDNQLERRTHVDASSVHTLAEIFAEDDVVHASPLLQGLRYFRVPIERENAPEHADVERLAERIRSATSPQSRNPSARTAFVFNCQMGKRRTTTALVLARLIWQQPQLRVESLSLPVPPPPQSSPSRDDGNFKVILELQKRLPFGREAKHWVDATIDACAAVCNIRTVIHEYHERSLSEAKPGKRSYNLVRSVVLIASHFCAVVLILSMFVHQHHALSFLERYFYLIVFGAYLLAVQHHEQQKQAAQRKPVSPRAANRAAARLHSFSKWLQHHATLFRLLDDLGGVKYKSDRVLDATAVLKLDHFPGLARIPFTLSENVPNFRQIANEPIFGSAQCLEAGIRDVAEYATENGYTRAIWINLREEAVVYVSGRPFVVRHSDTLMQNVEYPGIEVDEISAIEQQVKDELQTQVERANGLFMYWYEPRELVSEETIDHINARVEIKTLDEIYREVADTTGFDLRYARIPVSDETAPEEKDLDDMVRLLAPVFIEELGLDPSKTDSQQRTAVVCNCQMGRGRTTTALVCTYMLRLVLEHEAGNKRATAATVSSSPQSLLDRIIRQDKQKPPADALRRQKSSMIVGDFVVIRRLCETLTNGADAKALVDYAVNQCEHLQNLRECIAQCRDLAMDRELSSTKHDYYMLRAVNYLERYFYLLCFAAYLLEHGPTRFQQSLFVTWMNERYGSALYALLDNLCFEEDVGADTHVSSMRWRWRRKRKLISRLE